MGGRSRRLQTSRHEWDAFAVREPFARSLLRSVQAEVTARPCSSDPAGTAVLGDLAGSGSGPAGRDSCSPAAAQPRRPWASSFGGRGRNLPLVPAGTTGAGRCLENGMVLVSALRSEQQRLGCSPHEEVGRCVLPPELQKPGQCRAGAPGSLDLLPSAGARAWEGRAGPDRAGLGAELPPPLRTVLWRREASSGACWSCCNSVDQRGGRLSREPVIFRGKR
ncbi:MOB kinase activator 3B isoform X3 [Motacilla alba alba]|uniref:MOB kinase activator 3B isoform X3 n=1 Tax=Motacilla alba alba TaxID=1094192 RepID=UPI0018D4FC08|nr:MOB kinase activator 3B isoform X3 [Motacilla alba alba]